MKECNRDKKNAYTRSNQEEKKRARIQMREGNLTESDKRMEIEQEMEMC